MTSWNVCLTCGETFVADAANSTAIQRHLDETGHAGTCGTSNEAFAERLAAEYRSEQ